MNLNLALSHYNTLRPKLHNDKQNKENTTILGLLRLSFAPK